MSLFFSNDEIVVKMCIGESKTLTFDMNLKVQLSANKSMQCRESYVCI